MQTQFDQATGEARTLLEDDLRQGVSQLAELSDHYAANRDLLYRALLLKRELGRSPGRHTGEQLATARSLLDDIVSDYRSSENHGSARREEVDRIQAEALKVPIPRDVVLSAVGLTKHYRRSTFSLTDVNFDLRFGEITGVVGRNGNGKTTLFRLVVGELKPSAGQLTYPALGHEGNRCLSAARRDIAYVPQELPRWYGSLRNNLHYEAAVHGIHGRDNDREVDFIVERLGLSDELDKTWQALSGGFKLRFALARALVSRPKLLVLDEPLANLDFRTQQVVLKDLRNLTDSIRHPLAVLISSQHLHEVEVVSNKILFLKHGAVAFYGPLSDIGTSRGRNTFELGGSMDIETIRKALHGDAMLSVYYSGASFVVTTGRQTTAADVLNRLMSAGVEIRYFRDISTSTKSLFDDEPS